MKSAVLIDSSVWVAVSRGGDEALEREVAELLNAGQAAMTWPVWTELYQGAKGKREEKALSDWREICLWFEFDEACWKQAAVTARSCQRAGVNVPFGDVLVHACAKRYGVRLLERDRHFSMICEAMKP